MIFMGLNKKKLEFSRRLHFLRNTLLDWLVGRFVSICVPILMFNSNTDACYSFTNNMLFLTKCPDKINN